ncbi:MAG: hypothetical protein IPK13_19270 [Deltaproteobacteria bacterium]|nr:hypothetical protein [Deltaproteobacteria bacterium]
MFKTQLNAPSGPRVMKPGLPPARAPSLAPTFVLAPALVFAPAFVLAMAVYMLPRPLLAEPTRELSIQGPKEVFAGDPLSTSVDARGQISMGFETSDLAKLADYPVSSMVANEQGTLFAGTVGGGIHQILPNGTTKALDAEEKLMFSALAIARGRLFAATSPSGTVKVLTDGVARPFFNAGAKYVWAMLADHTALLVATGEPGQIHRVSPEGRSKVIFDPGETHVRALIQHPTRGLIAGGGQKGIVYQITGDETYALYDSSMDEVTSFAVDTKTGDLYASFVTESKPDALQPERMIGPVKGDTETDEPFPIKGSEVVRIAPNGRVDVLWNSQREGAMGLAFDGRKNLLYIATATRRTDRGRLYAVDPKNRDRLRLIARVDAPVISAVLIDSKSDAIILATSPAGRVLRVGPGFRSQSVYISEEQDLARLSRIGRIWFDADLPRGSKIELSIRSGNTREHDKTWSAWSKAVTDPDGADVDVTPGRYVQLQAVLHASAGERAPILKSLHASVVRHNVAPEVSEVFILRRGVQLEALPAEEEQDKTITLNTSVLNSLRAPEGRASRSRVRQSTRPGSMTIAWTAGDPNRDDLLFSVDIRQLKGPNPKWRSLARDIEDTFVSFDSRSYPDGRFQGRVRATDRPSNPPSLARTDENISEPFVIDNQPPTIKTLKANWLPSGKLHIEAEARDASSPISDADFAVDGSPWLMFPAADGLIDAKRERLALDFDPKVFGSKHAPTSGPRTLQVRVVDEAGNMATASIVVPASPAARPRR